jgi:hypothetical protein
MDQLFGATRTVLENSNVVLSVALDEAIALSEHEQYSIAQERAVTFLALFDLLADRLVVVLRTIEEHGTHFGTLPNVSALSAGNFRGKTAQSISSKDAFLAKILLGWRSRFFHKVRALSEIIEELQDEAKLIVRQAAEGNPLLMDRAWRELEVLGYDLNKCMVETTVFLKSFF